MRTEWRRTASSATYAKLDDVGRLADKAFSVPKDVHVVFNNAGIAYTGPMAAASHDDWRFVIDVDLWGPIHGVEAFLTRLIAQPAESHMVFTSSFAGLDSECRARPVLRCEVWRRRACRDVGPGGAGERHRGIGVVPDDRADRPVGEQNRASQKR